MMPSAADAVSTNRKLSDRGVIMATARGGRVRTVHVGSAEGGVTRLKEGLEKAAAANAPVVADLVEMAVVDGAAVAVLAAAAVAGHAPVVLAEESVRDAFVEWRLDTLWTTYTDAGAAREAAGGRRA
jgi:hypothetical protein